jgi:hypothetical protein
MSVSPIDHTKLMQSLQSKYAFQDTPEGNFANFGGVLNPDGVGYSGVDWAAWQAADRKYNDEIASQKISQDYSGALQAQRDFQDPYVQVTSGGQGIPGVSLRKSDYDAQVKKFQEQYPNVSPTSDATVFANFLRNSNSPNSIDTRGTYIGQTAPGLNYTKEQLGELSNQYFAQKRASKFRPGAAIAKLAGGLVLSGGLAAGLGAFAPAAAGAAGAANTAGAAGAAAAATTAAPAAVGGGTSSFLGSLSAKGALSGAALGGVGSLASGGSFSDVLKGAALGGVTGGVAPAVAGSIGIPAGPATKAFTGALQGATGGIAKGDLKSAGIGAVLGGAGGYITSGGNVPGLGSVAQSYPDLSPAAEAGKRALLGTGGTGILGDITRSVGGGLSSLTGGNTNMLGNALKIGGAIYEDKGTRENNEKIQRALQAAQGQAQSYLSPYVQAGSDATGQLSAALKAGFQPGDLTQDPGYQFRLQEGEKALQRRMAASGLGQSGAALKAAQEYGQGLADQTYNDAYQRWLSGNSQLLGAAGLGQGSATNSAQLAASMGDAQAAILASNQESKNKRLSSILSGIGAFF